MATSAQEFVDHINALCGVLYEDTPIAVTTEEFALLLEWMAPHSLSMRVMFGRPIVVVQGEPAWYLKGECVDHPLLTN